MKLHHLFKSFYLNTFLRAVFLLITLVVSFGFLIQVIEPFTFHSIWDGVWWGLVTIFTIGYGDLVPQTTSGKIVATIFILIGTGLGSYYMFSLSSQVLKRQVAYSHGELPFTERSHLVIVGWNERSKQVIEYLQKKEPSLSVVLIDSTLTQHPMNTHTIHFLKGDSMKDDILLKANIAHARALLITSDQHTDEQTADMHAILTLLAAKGLNQNLYCIVEILTYQHRLNAQRSGADVLIEGSRFTVQQISAAICQKELLHLFSTVADAIVHGDFTLIDVPHKYVGKDFLFCCEGLIKEEFIIVGIKREDSLILKPPSQTILTEHNQLVILK